MKEKLFTNTEDDGSERNNDHIGSFWHLQPNESVIIVPSTIFALKISKLSF